MKINETSGAGIAGLGNTQEVKPGGGIQKGKGTAAEGHDQVSLSSLSNVLSSSETESPQRAARLAALSQAIASGKYQVDSQAVSASIIRSSTRA